MTKQALTERLHERMHALPGMPGHDQAERLNHREGLHGASPSLANRALQNVVAGHEREPKVLIAWQRAIAGLLARRGR